MKTYYSEYVRHCLRFYARHPTPKFHSDSDKQNWYACDSAFKEFTDGERKMLLSIYRSYNTFHAAVYALSVTEQMPQATILEMVDKLERRIAKRRNLI